MNNKNYYASIEYNTTPNVWYTHYRGYIVKNRVDKDTNRIIQEKIEYNQPNNYLNYLDNYFKYKLK
jgi:hypothetical protein